MKLNEKQLLESKICVLPWNHIATHPDGYVTLCCESNKRGGMDRARNGATTLNLNIDSPITILPSESYQKVREQMLAGQEPAACTRCYKTESNGLKSKRVYEIESHFKRNDEFDTEVLKPSFVELRLGNLCNLQCVTCNPVSSRLLGKTFAQIKELKFINKGFIDLSINDSWTENEKFWDDLLGERDNLQKFYINGGEPTLITQHWKFLDKLIELDAAKNIELQYNINVTNMKQEYIDTWRKFKKVTIGCSIDDLDQRNYFIRYPANWPTLMKNLKMLLDNGIAVEITQTISLLNVYYLDEFSKFFGDMGLPIAMNYVYDPSFLSVINMPINIKNKVIEKLRLSLGQHYFENILATIDLSKENLVEFNNGLEYLQRIAEVRKLDLRGTFPEFFELVDNDKQSNQNS